MPRPLRRCILAIGLLLAPAAGAAIVPLRVDDPTSRPVFIQVESSSHLASVGQSFGPSYPATWSASGGVGTLTVSAQTFEAMNSSVGFPAIPASYTSFVVQIDLTTKHATSLGASGANGGGPFFQSFSLQPLASTATLGFAGPSVPPLACTSQAQIDQFCQFVPSFCGQTCTLVTGHAYEPASGEVNLIGHEMVQGCDGSFCQGPFDYFTGRGDLRLTEDVPIPAPTLSPLAIAALAGLLAVLGAGAVWWSQRR